jgi:hypothetical protein
VMTDRTEVLIDSKNIIKFSAFNGILTISVWNAQFGHLLLINLNFGFLSVRNI